MKSYTLEELTDQYIGKKGTKERDEFEAELNANYGLCEKRCEFEREFDSTSLEKMGDG